MLAESFLMGLAYRPELAKPPQCARLKSVGGESWAKWLVESDDRRDCHTASKHPEKLVEMCCELEKGQDLGQQKLIENPPPISGSIHIPLSAPQTIVRREQHCENELDLYRSWSCQSLYQNYPDLHIGGDHVADHTCDSGCIMDQSDDEPATAGPVLLSKDLGHSPPNESLQKMWGLKFWPGDEAGERSIVLHKGPWSNSVLNNYMESKMQELYKQFLEEKLARCNSLNHFVTSNSLMNHGSEQLPEQNTEVSKALLQSLALLGWQNPSNGNSNEFSTPNLQISAPVCKKTSAPV